MIATASLGTLLAVSLSAVGFSSSAQASAWELDPTPTVIAFSVRNLSVAHVDGRFRLASGHVTVDDADVSRSTIEAVIDAASVDTSETHLPESGPRHSMSLVDQDSERRSVSRRGDHP